MEILGGENGIEKNLTADLFVGFLFFLFGVGRER